MALSKEEQFGQERNSEGYEKDLSEEDSQKQGETHLEEEKINALRLDLQKRTETTLSEQLATQKEGPEKKPKRNPIPKELLQTPEGIAALEQALGIEIEQFDHNDTKAATVSLDGSTYNDSPRAIASRLAKEWLGKEGYFARVRDVFIKIKERKRFEDIVAEIKAQPSRKKKIEEKLQREKSFADLNERLEHDQEFIGESRKIAMILGQDILLEYDLALYPEIKSDPVLIRQVKLSLRHFIGKSYKELAAQRISDFFDAVPENVFITVPDRCQGDCLCHVKR